MSDLAASDAFLRPRPSTLTRVGWWAYAISFLLPVGHSSGILGRVSVSGLEAALWATTSGFDTLSDSYRSISGGTNLLMLASLVTRSRRFAPRARAMGVALVAAVVVNLGWTIEPLSSWPFGELGIAYWIWLFSFASVGWGLLRSGPADR